MTQEEKAQRYDVAIKRIENIKTGKCETTFMFTEGLFEHIFPELKESEDERIRKEMITYLSTVEDKELIPYESWITWLEKQCEHAKFRNKIQIGDKVTRNKDGVLVNLSQLKRVAKPAEEQGEQKQELLTKEKALKNSPFVEQKSAEWSEEDNKMSKFIGNAITADDASIYLESKGIQVIDAHIWLEELEERVQQPKQEWSEEDERHLNSVIKRTVAYGDSSIYGLIKDDIDWLKSLKERYTWKPSDEQMNALENVRKILHTNDIYSKANNLMYNFEELIRTLKKLREK